MANLWRVFDTTIGCWEQLKSSCLFLLLNLIWMAMLGAAWYYGQTSWSLRRDGSPVVGVVVGLEESPASDRSGVTYSPIIRYEVEGRMHTFTSSNSTNPPAYQIGERVALLYDSADPSRARIDSWWELWLMPVMLGGAALIVAVAINAVMIVSYLRGRATGV
jgi:hypothetical protein